MKEFLHVSGPKIQLPGWECQRCGHQWVPMQPNYKPITCPKCKSPFWETKPHLKKPKP